MFVDDDGKPLNIPPEFEFLLHVEPDTAEQDAELTKQSEAMTRFFREPVRGSAAADRVANQVMAEDMAAKMCGSELAARSAVGSLKHLDATFARPIGLAGDLYDFDLAKAQESQDELRKAQDDGAEGDDDRPWYEIHPVLAQRLAAVEANFRSLQKSLASGAAPELAGDGQFERVQQLREKWDHSYDEYVHANFNLIAG